MDLIDVVYKSLTYFGILAVIVIIGSYVSYRVRKKLSGERLPYEDDLEKAKAELKAQKGNKKQKTKEKKEDRDLKKPVIIHKEKDKNIIVKKRLRDTAETERRRKDEEAKKRAEYEKRKKRKEKQKFSRKHRIEIINKQYSTPQPDEVESKTPDPQSIRAKRTEETLPPKKKEKLQSLDENVLDKYADENDDQFFTIKPKNHKED